MRTVWTRMKVSLDQHSCWPSCNTSPHCKARIILLYIKSHHHCNELKNSQGNWLYLTKIATQELHARAGLVRHANCIRTEGPHEHRTKLMASGKDCVLQTGAEKSWLTHSQTDACTQLPCSSSPSVSWLWWSGVDSATCRQMFPSFSRYALTNRALDIHICVFLIGLSF